VDRGLHVVVSRCDAAGQARVEPVNAEREVGSSRSLRGGCSSPGVRAIASMISNGSRMVNGRTWASAASPVPGGALESAVCPSSTLCVAVGGLTTATNSAAQPLAVWWRGRE
jgi:hypothetical protein